MRDFRRTLLKAASESYDNGAITRLQLAKIRLTSILRPAVMEEIQDLVVDMATTQGVINDGSAPFRDGFDWNALLEFIESIITIILELIEQFS